MVDFVTLRNGVTLEYVECGDPYGMPVVFLHGATDSWRSFERVMRRLPSWMRAIAVSQRGDNRSADLEQFFDALDLAPALIVGHSTGSSVAHRFARDHQERVLGLVLTGAEFVETDASAELNTIEAPTLIVWGERDGIVPYSDQIALREAIPGSHLVVYSGAGHAVHWEDAATFAGDLVGFGTEVFINDRFPTAHPRPSAYDDRELRAAS
jgi:pimeloyl-ACP methyl ester carboxylesterase